MENKESAEVALGRATVNLTSLLDREMDAIFQNLLEGLDVASACERRRAVAANRVVLLCRNLAEEVRRYEHLYWRHRREMDAGEEEEFEF
jgi:hypothetical protein